MYLLKNLLRRIEGAELYSNVKMLFLGLRTNLRCRYLRKRPTGRRAKVNNDYKEIGLLVEQWFSKLSNLRYNMTLDDLSFQFGIPKRSLLNYFQNVLKKDFRTFKTEYRIDYAKEMLLENEDLNVADIAEIVGFKDKSNFHRQFKKQVGCTPCQWRNSGGHLEVLENSR